MGSATGQGASIPAADEPAEFADTIGLDEAELAGIESGAYQPPLSVVQQIHATVGEALSTRIEVYDNHDDVLELQYLRDPEGVTTAINVFRETLRQAKIIRRPPQPSGLSLGP